MSPGLPWMAGFANKNPRGRGFALRLVCGNCAELQRAWKNLPAIREGEDVSGRVVRTVFRPKSLNHNCFADFQCVLVNPFLMAIPGGKPEKPHVVTLPFSSFTSM